MTETIHIFDEFKIPVKDITDEIRHQKRIKIEPFIFNILRKKYGPFLEDQYKQNCPVGDASNCILIVEKRVHENLEFILHNVSYFARDWCIAFLCSKKNLAYCKKIAEPWSQAIHYLPFFNDITDRKIANEEYNKLMKFPHFWNVLPWETICIVQTDAYFLTKIPPVVLNYDYMASPASWNLDLMVGGFSIRKPKAMIKILKEFKKNIPHEDVFFSEGARELNLKYPKFPESLFYIFESIYSENTKPFGTHQWWTFFNPLDEMSSFHFENFLELDIPR